MATHPGLVGRRAELLGHEDARIGPGEVQEQTLGEVGAGRVAADADLGLGDPDLVDEVVVARETLDQLRRVLELGRELCSASDVDIRDQ